MSCISYPKLWLLKVPAAYLAAHHSSLSWDNFSLKLDVMKTHFLLFSHLQAKYRYSVLHLGVYNNTAHCLCFSLLCSFELMRREHKAKDVGR